MSEFMNFSVRLQKERKEVAGKDGRLGPFRPQDDPDGRFAWEWINGKKVFTQDSGAPKGIREEITRKVAAEIAREKSVPPRKPSEGK